MSGHRQCCQAFPVFLDGGKPMAAEGVLDIAGHCEVGPGVWRLQGIVPEFHGKQNQGCGADSRPVRGAKPLALK